MKLLTRRAFGILILSALLILGLLIFTFQYVVHASSWVQHYSNKHLYNNGQRLTAGKIYDRNGEILLETVDGAQKYNENEAVRTAVMHTVGDSNGNVVTAAQVAFGDKLSGWDMINGTYQWNHKLNILNHDLTLTLDAKLCSAAYEALDGRKGTVGVYNYKTGEILCMVSAPSFDPQDPPDVEARPERYEGVYINRLLSAAYTPGSVFKLVTAAAAIDNIEDYQTMVYHCDGEKMINGEKVTCLKAHGNVTLKEALAQSCNVAFAEMSLELGGETLQKYAEKAGFNESLKVNGINTATGKINVAEAEGGNLAWAGIGQYTDTANPLTFMAYVGSIANDGVRISPKIIGKEKGVQSYLSVSKKEKKRILTEETASVLKDMMRNNVIEVYGEGNYEGLELCAKSGTAEVGKDQRPHAWFAGFMDREDCPLAFVVVVENGGAGSKVAGPVAGKVLKSALKSMTGE